MKTFESPSEKLKDIELKNEAGVFRMKENEEGEVIVELENAEGKKFVLNELLPEGWKIVENNDFGTFAWASGKEVWIDTEEARSEGWKYALSVLHEIGHVLAFNTQKEHLAHIVGKERLLLSRDTSDAELFEKLQSKDERDAWAYALKQIRKVTEELNIDIEEAFGGQGDIREYVHEFLLNYKEGGKEYIEKMNLTEEEREELLAQVDKLYTHKDGE
ncbi:MAG: hypothetical protein WDZ40_03885 [Candidatus Spechtbacterales bacterium]